MFAKLFIFCSLFFLTGCGSSPSSSQNYEIAIDPTWAPLNFQDRQNNVLGFATELLTEVSKQESISIGTVLGSPEVLLLEKDPTILIHTYDNIPDTLNDLAAGNIQAALIPSLTARAYVNHLYFRKLKIVSKPLTEEALRLITLKGKSPQLTRKFNKALLDMKKNGDYDKLLSKWDLAG